MGTQAMETKYADMLAKVRGGSNLSNYATGNASGTVGFAGGPQTYASGGERFGIEGPDRAWAERMRQQAEQAQQAIEQQTQQTSQALTKLDQPLQQLDMTATGSIPQLGGLEQGIGGVASQALSAIPGLGKFGGMIGNLVQQLLGSLGGGGGGLFSLFGFADGGHVSGAGTGTSDSIPAMLSNGEFVVNAKATAANRPVLEAINAGKAPRFATGGIVSRSAFSSTTNNNINVSAASTGDPRRDRQFGDMLAGKIAAAVNPPDTFRRSEGQRGAAAAAQLQAAGVRNN